MKHLLMAGDSLNRKGSEFARFPCLNSWFRTTSAIILMMSDGTLQINFFQVSKLAREPFAHRRRFSGPHKGYNQPANGRRHVHRR